MNATMTIRYIGDEDCARRFLLQRQNGKFFTGRGWATQLNKARLYNSLAAAQRVYRAVMTRRCAGRKERRFTIRLDLSVFGGTDLTLADVRNYLTQAMQVNFDTAAAGDGPGGSFMLARAILGTLDEVGANPTPQAN